jgi:N-acetylmuramoyl-L-alanine amidase
MKKYLQNIFILLAIVSMTVSLTAQKNDSLFLRIIVPENDTTNTFASKQRFSGQTLSYAKLFMNGASVLLFPNGAFGGAVDVPFGISTMQFMVLTEKGDTLQRSFIMNRPEPMKTSPREPVVIEEKTMEPSQDRWLGKNDVLEVRFKGSPGYEASFDIEDVESGIPMVEIPASQTNGVEGMYIGKYAVRSHDEARNVKVKFRIRKSFWCSEKAYSRGKISILPRELPRVAEITGKKPYLNAGLGSDRLGGAKLGFLQSGIRIMISGKIGQQYRVQLGDGMEAWIPEDFVSLLPVETPVPRSLVGSISATGTDTADVIFVSLDRKLPYVCEQQNDPIGLTIDIFGATSNTNWITRHLSAKGIKSMTWSQAGAERYRLSILFNNQQHWGYDIGYSGNSTLKITVRRPPVITSTAMPLRGLVVAVDAGHGGDGNGAMGSTGSREKDINLSITKHLEELLLRRGAQVVMTRTNDTAVPMGLRADTVVSSRANLFVSVHCNSTGSSSDPLLTKGTSTYCRYPGFLTLRDIMYAKMLELDLGQFGAVNSFNFSLNAPTQVPNVLVETAFMSNPEDEMKLLDDSFRTRVAEQIVKGLEEFALTYGEKK